ncbi:undecaprenyl-diphosphate phosphatase [Metabacillus fastidiosus]|uniref:undecaprenyl-diphosphate phosphatase n=1 Tax=Metabacillus fastidiosus TaxID=1458 RepID=UPI0009EE36A6|nr:undecaprenyl-diphosphate phosphatase [Metabacillus fastidiosus]
MIINLAQTVALIPGMARCCNCCGNIARNEAGNHIKIFFPHVSFSGLILSISDLLNDPRITELILSYTAAFFASLIASYFSLKSFMSIMEKGNLVYFSMYCFIVGAVVLIFT